jgi:ABC-type branched-subunit amino acid transport system ATPase component
MIAPHTVTGVVLRVDGVCVRRGNRWPLREITIEVAAGEALGVLGPRASGKTALLDVISGFLRPERGHVVLDGENITRWPAYRIARAGVARSFQAAPQLDGAAVRDAVLAAAVGRGLSAMERRESVEEALAMTGLDAIEHRSTASLRPVERRLLCFARVAAAAPRLALLDEPLAGLPAADGGRIVSALRRLSAHGIALVVTAHDPASLRILCSRAVLLLGGRISGGGRPSDLDHA